MTTWGKSMKFLEIGWIDLWPLSVYVMLDGKNIAKLALN